ncbi:MAG: response regulator [Pseudomonadota bacterium]
MRDNGGELQVSLSQIEITSEDEMSSFVKPGYYVRLSVGDTGCGIDRSIMERVFEPYFTTKEQGEGTGLGLSAVHGIVKSYAGEIRVYSEPGKGTVFHVYFPCICDEACLPAPHFSEPLPRGTERILLIDDERQILEMERQMIERLGYRVTIRDNSPDALETFRDNPDEFDLVITDMTMPDMTGDALGQKLLRIRPDIPVLLCTGFSDRVRNEGDAAGIGIKGFLMKPISLRELAGTMRDLLDAAEQIESDPTRIRRLYPAYKEARGNLHLVN